MFLAEEMVDYSATNEDQVIAINEGHMILPEDHVMEVSNHVTSTNSHVIDAPDHVVQLDLAVSSHQQGSGREVQEEEEDEDD
ncbi:hypothetical protein AM593_10257, partial [Mytilus galloprovincialis]